MGEEGESLDDFTPLLILSQARFPGSFRGIGRGEEKVCRSLPFTGKEVEKPSASYNVGIKVRRRKIFDETGEKEYIILG
jgi:hypothetical protein